MIQMSSGSWYQYPIFLDLIPTTPRRFNDADWAVRDEKPPHTDCCNSQRREIMSKKFLHYWSDGRQGWTATCCTAAMVGTREICATSSHLYKFPGPRAQVEVVRIIACLLSRITSRLTYPEQSTQSVNKWRRPAHFPHHMVVIFLLLATELNTEQTYYWKQSGEAREVLAEPHRSQARKSLQACFLLSCPAPVWHLADLSIRLTAWVLSVCHLNTAGTISALYAQVLSLVLFYWAWAG